MQIQTRLEPSVLASHDERLVDRLRRSANRWCEADIAAGRHEEKARAAADRAKSFYTTPPTEATN